jgi:MarR family transcriptional regulator, repressor for mepA
MKEESIGHALGVTDILICHKINELIKKDNVQITSPIQIKVIMYLASKEVVYQKDLEKHFMIRRSTVSGILNTLEKSNYIVRISDKKDARVKKIVLTPKAMHIAMHIIDKVKSGFIKMNNILCQNISNEDLIVFYKVIKQIQLNLK